MESNNHEDNDDEGDLTAHDDTLRPTGGNAQVPGVSLYFSRSSNSDTPRLSQSLEFRVNVRFKVKVADLLNRIGDSGQASGEILVREVEEPVNARNGESELEASGKISVTDVEEPVTVIRNVERELEASGKTSLPVVKEPSNVPAEPVKGKHGKKRKRTSLRSLGMGSKKSSTSETGVSKEFFDVEKILDKRIGPEGEEYLLRWAGLSEKYDSWESTSHMQCDELIAEFSKQREQEIAARRSSDCEIQQNLCSPQQDTIDIAPNDEVLELPCGPSSSIHQVFSPQAKDDADPTLENENKPNSGDSSDLNSKTSTMTLPTPYSLRNEETSSLNTRASSSSVHPDICSTIGLFPNIDLFSINHESPPTLIPSTIVSTKIGHDSHRWFLVNWENYPYSFAWVEEEFIKRHFPELVIKFYEGMLYKQ